jgi:hypothetical protein
MAAQNLEVVLLTHGQLFQSRNELEQEKLKLLKAT